MSSSSRHPPTTARCCHCKRRGAKILPIPLEEDGIDVSALEAALQAGARPRLAHIIPTFQNPAGCTLSLDKRRRLLALAEQYDFVIFEDDPYIELRFEGERLPTMLSLDENDRVVYASSFTKTVCPGVRVGYLAGPAAVISRAAKLATETYISPSMVTESIVNEFCRSGAIDSSIQTVTLALHERLGALVAALVRELPEARFTPPTGGYFLWVDLPDTLDVDALFAAALDRGVVFVKGDGLSARRWPSFPAVGLLRGQYRRDRRGRHPAGRRLPLARRCSRAPVVGSAALRGERRGHVGERRHRGRLQPRRWRFRRPGRPGRPFDGSHCRGWRRGRGLGGGRRPLRFVVDADPEVGGEPAEPGCVSLPDGPEFPATGPPVQLAEHKGCFGGGVGDREGRELALQRLSRRASARPGTSPKDPPSADAAISTDAMAGSTALRSTRMLSVSTGPAADFPPCDTAPEACRGWL